MVPAAALPQLSRVTLGKQLPSFSCKASVNLNKAPRRRQNPAFVTKETGFLSMLIKLEPCLHNEQQPAGRKPLHNAELTITPLRITCCEISHDPAKKKSLEIISSH